MIKATIIVVILIAITAAVVLAIRARTPSGPQVGSYGDIKKQIIEQSRAAPNTPRPEPVRPDGLDKRLSLETMGEHDKLKPTAHKAYDIAAEVMESVYEELVAIDERADAYHLISEPRQALYAAYWVEAEINNGGLSQYYLNSAGDQAADAPKYLRALGIDEVADILQEANAFFPSATPPRDRRARLAILDDVEERASQTWNELDNRFFQSGISFQPNMIAYIRDNRAAFYKID